MDIMQLALTCVFGGLIIVLVVISEQRRRGFESRLEQGIVNLERENRRALKDSTLEIENAVSLARLSSGFPVFLGGASIDPFHARSLVTELLYLKPSVVFELGAGSSSILLASSMQLLDYGEVKHYAIEHDPKYLEAAKLAAKANQVCSAVEFRLCPLTSFEGVDLPWYEDVSKVLSVGETIDLLIVDGPPATKIGSEQAREPALRMMLPFLSSTCTIIVDDTNRDGESQIVERWQLDFPEFSVERIVRGKGHAIFRRTGSLDKTLQAV